MFFEDYVYYPNAKVSPSLLWEYDYNSFDWKQMQQRVVERVVQRGDYNDWYAILNMYGVEGVKDSIKKIKNLDSFDANFVSNVFKINKEEMQCYKLKPFLQTHWNS
ncbi:MAG: hypothetical protein LIP09_09815 [Bacteroidales bacterium]|nr:hypothetical protein [Bacteroidales bacterium]